MALWEGHIRHNLSRRSSSGIMEQEEGHATSAAAEGDTGFWAV